MFKQFYIPLFVVLAIFFGIDFLADSIKDFLVAILPQQFQDVAPLADFLLLPIDAITNTVASLTAFFLQFLKIFTGLFYWIFGDGTFVEIISAIILMISSIIAFVAYLIIAVISTVAALIIIVLGFFLSLTNWIF